MTVRVLLFASYADVLGTDSLAVELPDEATTADVVAAVRARPGGERLPPAPLVAVNQRWVPAGTVIRPADEVALLPPVAGG